MAAKLQTAEVEIVVMGDAPARHPMSQASMDIAAINEYHRKATGAAAEARSKAEEAAHFALLAGTRLEALKGHLQHGEWGTLFTGRKNPNSAQSGKCAEFEFSQDTASRYIEVAKSIRLERKLSTKAVKQLSNIAAAPVIDEKSRGFLNKLTEGKSLRQLYLDLDIISAKPEKANPAQVPAISKPEQAKPALKSKAQIRIEDAREAIFLWQEQWAKLVKSGHLDSLPVEELPALSEFVATARDSIKKRTR